MQNRKILVQYLKKNVSHDSICNDSSSLADSWPFRLCPGSSGRYIKLSTGSKRSTCSSRRLDRVSVSGRSAGQTAHLTSLG